MARLFLVPGILSSVVLIFWLWALVDVITTDSLLIRNMQKSTWVCLVVIVPTLGAVAWVLFGRPEGASMVPGGQIRYQDNPYRSEPDRYRSSPRVAGPEDSASWSKPSTSRSLPSSVGDSESLAIRERKLMEKEAELVKKEAELQARQHSADPDVEE